MKTARAFLYSAAILFLITATAKLVSSFGTEKILLEREPLLGIQFRELFRIVGGCELIVAFVCFWSRQIRFSTVLVAWLATTFVAYRYSLLRIGWHKPCACLGNLTAAVHMSSQVADNIMKGVLVYLLIGSYGILIHQWWKSRQLAVGRSELGDQSPQTEAGS
jgi:hypothetical protein